MTSARFIAALLLLPAPLASAAEHPLRYVALLSRGQRIESDRLTNWHVANALPQLGSTSLLDPANAFRWLIHRTRRLAETPPAYVEMTNGDRLPGVVVDYRSGGEDIYHPLPPHLIVRVTTSFEPPNNKPVPEIRVATQFVRRVVWQRRGAASATPGTALYRDGRTLPFRAVRWKRGEVQVLLADGSRLVDWDELAELQLPAADPWSAWFDQVATVCPTSDSRLLQAETATGLVATASLATFAARFEGNSADPDRWVHGLQPAWSLDILWIPFREIAVYRCFAPQEAPLSLFLPENIQQGWGLAAAGRAQVNRSASGSPLASRRLEFGWGFGVAGGAELSFALPAGVRAVRTSVCLDRSVDGGGCIRPRIFLGDTKGKPLWEGPVLVGSETAADTGRIALVANAKETQTIVLQIDAVLASQPRGADPLDIRDRADWCDPLVELDPAFVQAELDRRLGQQFLAWRGWDVRAGGGSSAAADWQVLLHQNAEIPGAFEPAIHVEHRPLVLRRDLTIGPRDNWLVIAATRASSRLPEPKIEVRIDGQVAGEFTVPAGAGDWREVRPLAVPLVDHQRQKPRRTAIEIRQLASPHGPPVQYRSIAIAAQLPTLYQALEEAAEPIAVEPGQSGTATITADDRLSGEHSLRLTPAGRFRIELADVVRIRATPEWGEARFVRFAVRKRGGGRLTLEFEDAQPRTQSARYDLGQGRPLVKSVHVGPEALADEWIVITRDLFADFENMDVKALLVGCPDGESALIDHVYFARSRADFDLALPSRP
jgi:hypothetical protein